MTMDQNFSGKALHCKGKETTSLKASKVSKSLTDNHVQQSTDNPGSRLHKEPLGPSERCFCFLSYTKIGSFFSSLDLFVSFPLVQERFSVLNFIFHLKAGANGFYLQIFSNARETNNTK